MVGDSYGELVPVGGGDPIPLRQTVMTIGRREGCSICLRFPNVSGLHCELSYRNGYWFFRDMGSSNGIKVNGVRVLQKAVRPGDELAVANRRYTIQYNLKESARVALENLLAEDEDILSQSLLEKAGLTKARISEVDD